jgi:hypothetical protein
MSALSHTADASPRAHARGAAAPTRATLLLGSALATVSAGIDLAVAPERLAQWIGYGAFFFGAAAAQLALVVALATRPSPAIVQAGIWTTVGTMVMYLVSRTAGIPLGPDAGTVEGIDALGVTATVAEAALVVTLCTRLSGSQLRRTTSGLALVGVLLWLAAAGGYLSPPTPAAAAGHGGHRGAKVLPRIPDRVRYAPRPPGIG